MQAPKDLMPIKNPKCDNFSIPVISRGSKILNNHPPVICFEINFILTINEQNYYYLSLIANYVNKY